MARKDENFDFDTESKSGFSLDLSFFKNLTKKQKRIILAAIIAVVAIIAIVISLVVIGSNGGFDNSGNNNGPNSGNNGEVGVEEGGVDAAQISQIYLSATPEKTVYNVGDEFDSTGILVTVMLTDGNNKFLHYNEHADFIKITGFDSSAPAENQVITIEYKGFTCTYNITVKDFELEPPTIVSIHLDPLPKTQYKVDELFTVEGGKIVCTYDDGSTKTIDLTPNHVSGFGAMSNGVGEYTITVKLRENGKLYKTTYTITVTE